jgi:phage terminase large subunit
MTTTNPSPRVSPGTLKLIELAKSLRLPKDSLKRFLQAGYVPQPKQLIFHAAARAADSTDNAKEIGFGGARGPGKTHATFAQVALDDCQRVAGLKVLFLRKVAKSANEAIEDLRQSVLFKTPHRYKEQKSTIIFPNQSRIILGHFQYEKDIDNYLGLEYDIIVIEEATQLSQSKIDKIKSCNRSSKDGFRPRRYYTTNPGGVGHQWFKSRFITPFREGKAAEAANKTKFIPATSKDNKKLNKEYVKDELEPLTGWLREAWLNGNWDVFAGQYFDKFNYDLHTFDDSHFFTPEFLKANWENIMPWGGFDWGFVHWAVFYLGYKYEGQIYILDECAVRKQLDQQIAKEIVETCARWNLKPSQLRSIAAGTDCFETNTQTGKTKADVFADHGVYLTQANTSRQTGWSKILTLLGDVDQGINPTVKINRRCRMLIEQLPALEHNPDKPGDVKKTNADDNGFGGDDAGDGVRYFVMDDNESTGIF